MTAQLEKLSIPLERIPAIDACETSDAFVDDQFASGPLGQVGKGDKCCTLSHRNAWEAFLRSESEYGLILEDDVALDQAAARLLRSDDWIPRHIHLLKLEQYVEDRNRIVVDEPEAVANGHAIARLRSKHTGAAAYILSRRTAELLCRTVKWTLPVDHLLFNPNNSPIFSVLEPYQMLPPIARQSRSIGGATDIDIWRKELRRPSLTTAYRELRHGYYELRLLPTQIFRILSGRSYAVRASAGVGQEGIPAAQRRSEALAV